MPARSNPERCEFLAKLLGCPGLPVRFPNTRHPEDRNEHIDLMVCERRPLIDCSLDVLNKGAALIAITATPVPMFHASPFKCAKLITNSICCIGQSPVPSARTPNANTGPHPYPGNRGPGAAVRAGTQWQPPTPACGVGDGSRTRSDNRYAPRLANARPPVACAPGGGPAGFWGTISR